MAAADRGTECNDVTEAKNYSSSSACVTGAVPTKRRNNAPAAWDALTAAAPKKPAGAALVAQWVFDNMEVSASEITCEGIPSAGAVGLLRWCREDVKNRGEFYKTIWSKTLPSKTEIDATSRFNDDGREVLGVLDRVEAAVAAVAGPPAAPPSPLPSEVFEKPKGPPLPSEVFGVKPADASEGGPSSEDLGTSGDRIEIPKAVPSGVLTAVSGRSLGKRGR